MGNIWTDQPHDAEGIDLLTVILDGGKHALHIQASDIGGGIMNYAGTVGGLLESKTFIDHDLEQLLKTVSAYISREL